MQSTQIELEAARLDREIGARVRRARKERGLTQTQLGESLNVSFQQVQKYERGTNRISSSALILIARVLDVSPHELLGSDGAKGSDIDWELFSVDGADELPDHSHRAPAPHRRPTRPRAGRPGVALLPRPASGPGTNPPTPAPVFAPMREDKEQRSCPAVERHARIGLGTETRDR
jgi:transcriptional regulator with XRE-family HTH domain